jgi:hypothetical protein
MVATQPLVPSEKRKAWTWPGGTLTSEPSTRDDVQNYSAKYVTEARKLQLIPA